MKLLGPLRLWLLIGLAACSSKETPAPTGAIAGAMPPVPAVGRLLTVTAAGPGNSGYQAAADPVTGAFAFPNLPPGTCQLKFSTSATQDFPHEVTATVAAGATATPAIPPVTHDGVGRGTLRWVRGGQPFAATTFIRVSGQGSYFYLQGRSGDFGGPAEVNNIELMLFQPNTPGPVFNGVGTCPLGGNTNLMPYGGSSFYVNNQPELFERYTTPGGFGYTGPASGTAHLTRYDGEQGYATGTFTFTGY
ncbi:MAG: hypothetical protein EOO59_16875, partial [Hymenobacter sp.]